MKKKLLWICAIIVLVIFIVVFLSFNMRDGESIQTDVGNTKHEQKIQEYHETDITHQGLDYLLEKEMECYDMSGNLIKNPQHEQWNTLNCYLYYENGQMMFKASSIRENLEGEDRVKSILYYYYRDGNIESETTYINGEKNGEFIKYYENGQKMLKGYLENGQKNGTRIYFYESGQIQSYGQYLNGEQNGKRISYYKNGQKEVEVNMKNGKEDGIGTHYYENGKIMGYSQYSNGIQNGKRISFYENGQKEQESYFKNGLPDGEFIRYYENGSINTKGNYKNGVVEGKVINYYENGQILGEATFKNGELVEEKIYDENGKIMN